MKLFLTTIALFLTSANAMSCSCIRERGSLEDQVAAAFASAALVVWAKAESTQDNSRSEIESSNNVQAIERSDHFPKQRTTFVTIESLKGDHPERFATEVVTVCCVCGYRFTEGKEYLLYLHNGPNEAGYYHANICTRTKQMTSAATEEVEVLRKLRHRFEPKIKEDDPSPNTWCHETTL